MGPAGKRALMDETPPDSQLVHATLRGDRSAFGQLVQRYERSVLASAAQVLMDFQLAQDAAQEAFVSAYRNLGRLRNANSFGPWVLTIVHHQALRLLRSRKMTCQLPADHAMAEAQEMNSLDGVGEQLLKALSHLPEHERIVLLLRHFESRDVESIARITGRPVGTVTKQLSRAHQRLRKLLEDKP